MQFESVKSSAIARKWMRVASAETAPVREARKMAKKRAVLERQR